MKLFALCGLALGQRNFGPNFPDEMDPSQDFWIEAATTSMMGDGGVSQGMTHIL